MPLSQNWRSTGADLTKNEMIRKLEKQLEEEKKAHEKTKAQLKAAENRAQDPQSGHLMAVIKTLGEAIAQKEDSRFSDLQMQLKQVTKDLNDHKEEMKRVKEELMGNKYYESSSSFDSYTVDFETEKLELKELLKEKSSENFLLKDKVERMNVYLSDKDKKIKNLEDRLAASESSVNQRLKEKDMVYEVNLDRYVSDLQEAKEHLQTVTQQKHKYFQKIREMQIEIEYQKKKREQNQDESNIAEINSHLAHEALQKKIDEKDQKIKDLEEYLQDMFLKLQYNYMQQQQKATQANASSTSNRSETRGNTQNISGGRK